MMTRRLLLSGSMLGLAAALTARWWAPGLDADAASAADQTFPVSYAPDEWRKRLTPGQFDVLRQAGTERPFSSPLLHETRRGTFTCAGCDRNLFLSTTKFDSGTGWPSFWAPIASGVGETTDHSFLMTRTAVHCSGCGGHLGHVFNDGPQPTGLRYCMNGVALAFRPA